MERSLVGTRAYRLDSVVLQRFSLGCILKFEHTGFDLLCSMLRDIARKRLDSGAERMMKRVEKGLERGRD